MDGLEFGVFSYDPFPESIAVYTASSAPRNTWLQVKLEEYRALRSESLEAIRAQHQVLVYSLALIAGLTAAAGQIWDKNVFVASIIFLFAIPSFAYMLIFVWLGEVERLQRVGHWIMGIEDDVNRFVGGNPMGWEGHMRDTDEAIKLQLHRNYKAILAVLLGTGLAAPFVGDVAVADGLNQLLSEKAYSHWIWGLLVAWGPAIAVIVYDVMTLVAFAWVVREVRATAQRFYDFYSRREISIHASRR